MIMHFYTQKVFVVMEKCDRWNCPFCNWGYCTGDKEYAYEMHFCTKQNLNSEYDYE